MTPLLIVTLSVIGLVIVFFGVAWLASSSRTKRGPKAGQISMPQAVAGAIALYDPARTIAGAAKNTHEDG